MRCGSKFIPDVAASSRRALAVATGKRVAGIVDVVGKLGISIAK